MKLLEYIHMVADFLNFLTSVIYFHLLIILCDCNIIASVLHIYIVVANRSSYYYCKNTACLISLYTGQSNTTYI